MLFTQRLLVTSSQRYQFIEDPRSSQSVSYYSNHNKITLIHVFKYLRYFQASRQRPSGRKWVPSYRGVSWPVWTEAPVDPLLIAAPWHG